MQERAFARLRRLVGPFIAVVLFSFQQIPVAFSWTWPMLFPLAAYFTSLPWVNGEVLPIQIRILFCEQRLMPGRIIAVTGFILFLMALFQFVRQRGKLISSGLYSIVRHPQYFGLIIAAYGISVMAGEFGGNVAGSNLSGLLAGIPWLASWLELFPWLTLVLGYVLLALFEESSLTEEPYRQYKKEVPFVFPVPHSSRIQEAVLSVTIIVAMQLILMLRL